MTTGSSENIRESVGCSKRTKTQVLGQVPIPAADVQVTRIFSSTKLSFLFSIKFNSFFKGRFQFEKDYAHFFERVYLVQISFIIILKDIFEFGSKDLKSHQSDNSNSACNIQNIK